MREDDGLTLIDTMLGGSAGKIIAGAEGKRHADRPHPPDMSLGSGRAEGQAPRRLPGAQTKPNRTIDPGDRVGSLEVIAAPGHTPGHVALLDLCDRTLCCGDAYSTLGGRDLGEGESALPLALFTWHRPTGTRERLGTARP